MMNFTLRKAFVLCSLGLSGMLNAQITFVNSNSILHSDAGTLGSNGGNHGGNSLCIIDVNNDGLDDLVKLDENQYLRIEYGKGGGAFNYQYVGDCGLSSLWGMSMSDVNHDGIKDLLYGNGNQAWLFKLNSTGTAFAGSGTALPNGNIFCQNVNFMDVNNDGWEDIFSTNDVDECRLWVNNGAGNFPAEQNNSIINFNTTPGTGPGPALSGGSPNDQYDESGNYSSVWTDFDGDGDVDLYIAHCRQGSSPGDVRRIDRLYVNNGNGTYTESGSTYNLNSGEEDWTSSFGDIDNDGDFDLFLTRVNVASRVFLNDGNGNMSSLTTLATTFNQPYQSVFEDFDNDGFVDIFMAGVSQQQFFRNNGNNTFTQVTNSNLGFTNATMLSFAIGDLNHDGKIDVYSSYGSGYNSPSNSSDDIYWKNTTNNSNHFITFELRGTTSNMSALGARVYIYGAWGVQTREVRASESYGTTNTSDLHFGLGSSSNIDSVVIDWPASTSPNTVIINPTVDQFLVVTEGNCISPDNKITYTGSPVICSPGSLTLNAATGAGYTYLWSTGATTPSINVSVAGDYNVRVTAPGNTCVSWSPIQNVSIDPVESVTISATGSTTICEGSSVVLTSSQPNGNTWSNNQTSSTISATVDGAYSVVYQGVCQTWNSNVINVDVLPSPAPVTVNDTVTYPAVGTVTATGSAITWYDAASGGAVLGTGTSYSPGVINTTTTYYAEDVYSYGSSNTSSVGSTNIAGSDFSTTSLNGHLRFSVTSNCTLVSVQCSTTFAGNRTIELRNSSGTVITSAVVNIPTGTNTITLNFPLTPGTDYQLGTNTADNNTVFGVNSPRLVRDNGGASYPYTIPGILSILSGNNGTSNTTSAYYYFYNWQVEVDSSVQCTSARTPATIVIDNGSGIENNTVINLNVYPNPADEMLNLSFTTSEMGEATISVLDVIGRAVYSTNLGTINGTYVYNVNTSSYAPGMYTIKLLFKNKEYNTKVIIK